MVNLHCKDHLHMIDGKSVCEENNFREIFDGHSETIRNFVFYKCGNMAQAEDITQDAFIKLWKNCEKVIFAKAKSYVMKIAQNTFYNEADHKKVVLRYVKQYTMDTVDRHNPEFLMEENEFMAKLQKSIADLPEKNRVVFLLSRKDKKTYKEIAEVVGIGEKAVERRMHLALKELRKKIDRKI